MRRFAPYMVLKVVFNALILNYAASAFIVSACLLCALPWFTSTHLQALLGILPAYTGRILSALHVLCTGVPRLASRLGAQACPCFLLPALPSQVLWLSDCLAIWRSVYYCGHLAILAIIAAGIVLPPRKPKRDTKPDKAGRTVDGVDAAPAVPAVPVGAPVAPVAAIDEGKKDH